MDKAALLVLVEQDKINGGAFHTFWEEDQKGLNYSILPKTFNTRTAKIQWMISAM